MSEVRSASDVVRYLVGDYEVDSKTAAKAVAERHQDKVADAIRFGSFAYYPGDKIAAAEGWVAKENPASEAEDDEEDDG